jgi:hypothetical protein
MIAVAMLPAIAPPDAPLAPGWWPLAPGWWFLGAALLMLLIWGAGKLLWRLLPQRRVIPPDIRTFALAALDELAARPALAEREAAFRLNEILRAALIDVHGTGHWRPFMPRDDLDIEQGEWDAFWAELDGRYRPQAAQGDGRQQRWIATARYWVECLPDRDGVRMHL